MRKFSDTKTNNLFAGGLVVFETNDIPKVGLTEEKLVCTPLQGGLSREIMWYIGIDPGLGARSAVQGSALQLSLMIFRVFLLPESLFIY